MHERSDIITNFIKNLQAQPIADQLSETSSLPEDLTHLFELALNASNNDEFRKLFFGDEEVQDLTGIAMLEDGLKDGAAYYREYENPHIIIRAVRETVGTPVVWVSVSNDNLSPNWEYVIFASKDKNNVVKIDVSATDEHEVASRKY